MNNQDTACPIGDASPASSIIDERYEELENGIVLQAVRDYRAAKAQLRLNPGNYSARGTASHIKRFFRSEWFKVLTSVDPEYLIKKLDGEEKL